MTADRLTPLDRAALAASDASPQYHGIDVVLHGAVDREKLAAALDQVVEVWPALGSVIEYGRWQNPCVGRALLHFNDSPAQIENWRSAPCDPRETPPLQVLAQAQAETWRLGFRFHPAVADEQAAFHVFVSTLMAIAGEAPLAPSIAPARLIGVRHLLDRVNPLLVSRHLRQLAKFTRQDQVWQLAGVADPGPVKTYSRWVNTDILLDKANRLSSTPPALVSVAWARALAELRSQNKRKLLIAVPVSFRDENAEAASTLSNLMWPVYIEVDQRASLRDTVRAFAGQLRTQTQARLHHAQPLAALSRHRFWQVARRFPKLDVPRDFGSTRVTWTGHPAPLTERLEAVGVGIVDLQLYSPVPVSMGATLTLVTWPRGTQFIVNYRPGVIDERTVIERVNATLAQMGP